MGRPLMARLVASARARLKDDGLFVFEFGLGQEARVTELSSGAGWRSIETRCDLQGIPRTAVLRADG